LFLADSLSRSLWNYFFLVRIHYTIYIKLSSHN